MTALVRNIVPATEEPPRSLSLDPLYDWLRHAQYGDAARGIIAPQPRLQCAYGSPLPATFLDFHEALLGGGDFLITQNETEPLITVPLSTFRLAMMEGAR